MGLKAWGVSVVLAGTAAVGGMALPGSAGAAVSVGAAAPPAVSCQPTEGQMSAACSAGVFPEAYFRAQSPRTGKNGYPDAECVWHPPLQFGYEELFY